MTWKTVRFSILFSSYRNNTVDDRMSCYRNGCFFETVVIETVVIETVVLETVLLRSHPQFR
jgi:hypothetical protein